MECTLKMPMPNKDESKEEYIARFMGSEEAKKSHPDEKQRLAIAYSMWKKHSEGEHKMKETTVFFEVVKTKELENKSKQYTFIGASTLPDRASSHLSDGTKVKGEILSKNVLDTFANKINDASRLGGDYGSYRTISLFHNRVYTGDYSLEEAGYVMPGSAKVLELESSKGNYGLFVDVEVNEKYVPPVEYQDYIPEKIHYKIDKGALGLSLEYNNKPEQEKIVSVNGELYRYIMGSDDFRGFGFARPDLIGNTSAVRVKEINLNQEQINKGETQMEDTKLKEMEQSLTDANAKVKELQTQIESVKAHGEESNVKLKETIAQAFAGLQINAPAKTKEANAKVKEIYQHVESLDFVKFKEAAEAHIEENGAKIKELMARDGVGFDFEKWQTLQVKCKGNQMVVVPTAKTKDVLDATSMNEATYYQTNAMFADRYVAGITETFLKEDSLMKVITKEQHLGGNDKYQWKVWVDYATVTGDNTLAVDPNNTSVARTVRKFLKMETPIREYRDGCEVTDFVQAHSMAAVGDLLGLELQRAAEAVTESMNADLFKSKADSTAAWVGFNGLLGFADSTTHSTIYGRVRSAANMLLDSTLANTYVTTSEGISVSVVRLGYEKVLAHGSSIGDITLVMHPTQCRRLFDSEDAAIRNNILTMAGAPPTFGFNRNVIPYCDGIPIIRDYRCESSAAAADMFAVVDLSSNKGLSLVISKPLGARGLAKVGTSESAYVNFWGATVYKSPRNVFVHTGLTAT